MGSARRAIGLALFAALLGLAGCRKGPGQIDRARLLAATRHPEQWLTTGGDFGKTHFSGLIGINASTVARLGYAWGFGTDTDRGLEATPIVVDGVMYTSGVAGRVYALDARTGKLVWRFEPQIDPRVHRSTCCDAVNRGVAVWRGRVYVAALDGVLYALDASTGKPVWRADTVIDRRHGYSSTGAPEIAGDVVVIGNAGGDFDARGYVTAYDLNTGRQAWRFFTVPGDPNKPPENPELADAAKTWDPASRWDLGGGGNAWDGMTYDPELKLLYVATGNGEMYARAHRSPKGGDNLFVSSILAIRPDTGRLAWRYQETPGDQWDYDSDAPILLTTVKIDGAPRKVLMHAPKNGFFYILDRANGRLLSAKPYVPVTWARAVDLKTGRPFFNPDADYTTGPKLIFPSSVGGHVWNPMAFSPDTGLVYLPAIEGGMVMSAAPAAARRPGLVNVGVKMVLLNGPQDLAALPEGMRPATTAGAPDLQRRAYLRAWDPVAHRTAWQVPTLGGWDHAGVLATAGGLVFQGSNDGHIRAFDARTGQLMKDIDTGTSIIAAPMTYAVNGVQYVSVMGAAGGGLWFIPHPQNASYKYGNQGRILTFRLDGGPTPKPAPLPPIEPIPPPPTQAASASTIERGKALFDADCTVCHVNLARTGSADLTRLDPSVHKAFDEIVLGGLLKDQGMPQWSDVLTKDDAHAIHAYVIEMSQDAYRAQQSKAAPTRQLIKGGT
ncbi:MAG TPA: PQQ-dependent dehydrogenase, methanol/ethanol family [Caulobacteraceae bacterium]|jgi:quinohemoprotein ethanol dehydrogenase